MKMTEVNYNTAVILRTFLLVALFTFFLKRKTFSVKDTFPYLIRRTFIDILYRIREIYKFYIYTQFTAKHTLWQDQDVLF